LNMPRPVLWACPPSVSPRLAATPPIFVATGATGAQSAIARPCPTDRVPPWFEAEAAQSNRKDAFEAELAQAYIEMADELRRCAADILPLEAEVVAKYAP